MALGWASEHHNLANVNLDAITARFGQFELSMVVFTRRSMSERSPNRQRLHPRTGRKAYLAGVALVTEKSAQFVEVTDRNHVQSPSRPRTSTVW